jgi:IrrE N-terminal-like domain
MRFVPDLTGRFPERPYYEPADLNDLCEGLVETFLKRKYGEAAYPIRTDDLTVLIEQQEVELDLYCDLSTYGPETEGASVFAPDAPTRVFISVALSDTPQRQNRYRATLAHELGHVLLHGPLFRARSTGDLFESFAASRTATCKRGVIEVAARSDWLEWQAAFMSGALLMPASAVRRRAAEVIQSPNHPVVNQTDTLLADTCLNFQVSRSAAEVRLSQLGLIRLPHALPLL